jgi:hypothetical protein
MQLQKTQKSHKSVVITKITIVITTDLYFSSGFVVFVVALVLRKKGTRGVDDGCLGRMKKRGNIV